MNSKYLAFGLGVKGIAFIPSIAAFITFGCLIWRYGRDEFVVEKVVEDLDKVDGVVIEEVDLEVEPGEDVSRQKPTASVDSRQNDEGVSTELPTDQEEGKPMLLNVQQITYV